VEASHAVALADGRVYYVDESGADSTDLCFGYRSSAYEGTVLIISTSPFMNYEERKILLVLLNMDENRDFSLQLSFHGRQNRPEVGGSFVK